MSYINIWHLQKESVEIGDTLFCTSWQPMSWARQHNGVVRRCAKAPRDVQSAARCRKECHHSLLDLSDLPDLAEFPITKNSIVSDLLVYSRCEFILFCEIKGWWKERKGNIKGIDNYHYIGIEKTRERYLFTFYHSMKSVTTFDKRITTLRKAVL